MFDKPRTWINNFVNNRYKNGNMYKGMSPPPHFDDVSREASGLIHSPWIAISQGNLYKTPAQVNTEENYSTKTSPYTEEQRRSKVKTTLCASSSDISESDIISLISCVVPLGEFLSTLWSVEGEFSNFNDQTKVGLDWERILEGAKTITGSVLLQGHLVHKSGVAPHKLHFDMAHSQPSSESRICIDYYYLNSNGLISLEQMQRITPALTVGMQHQIHIDPYESTKWKNTMAGTIRYAPSPYSLVTAKCTRYYVRSTYIQQVTDWLTVAGDINYNTSNNALTAGLGTETKFKQLKIKVGGSTDGNVNFIMEGTPKEWKDVGKLSWVTGIHSNLSDSKMGLILGFQLQ